MLAINQGDCKEASKLLEQSLEIRKNLDDKEGIARVLNDLGLIAQEQGDSAKASKLLEQSQNILEHLNLTSTESKKSKQNKCLHGNKDKI